MRACVCVSVCAGLIDYVCVSVCVYACMCVHMSDSLCVCTGLKKFSDWPTYPQLYVNGELLGGLDILKEMAESGELEQLLPATEDLNTR